MESKEPDLIKIDEDEEEDEDIDDDDDEGDREDEGGLEEATDLSSEVKRGVA